MPVSGRPIKTFIQLLKEKLATLRIVIESWRFISVFSRPSMILFRSRVWLIACAALAVCSGVASSQAAPDLKTDRLVSARRLDAGGVPLDGVWQFRLGDNASWSLPTYGDADWTKLAPGEPLPDSLVERVRAIEASGKP